MVSPLTTGRNIHLGRCTWPPRPAGKRLERVWLGQIAAGNCAHKHKRLTCCTKAEGEETPGCLRFKNILSACTINTTLMLVSLPCCAERANSTILWNTQTPGVRQRQLLSLARLFVLVCSVASMQQFTYQSLGPWPAVASRACRAMRPKSHRHTPTDEEVWGNLL